MPTWVTFTLLTFILKWGGFALGAVSAGAIVYVEMFMPSFDGSPTPGQIGGPVTLYAVLLVVGLIYFIFGIYLARHRAEGGDATLDLSPQAH